MIIYTGTCISWQQKVHVHRLHWHLWGQTVEWTIRNGHRLDLDCCKSEHVSLKWIGLCLQTHMVLVEPPWSVTPGQRSHRKIQYLDQGHQCYQIFLEWLHFQIVNITQDVLSTKKNKLRLNFTACHFSASRHIFIYLYYTLSNKQPAF